MDVAQAEAWLHAYGRAWELQDADRIVDLFVPDARYHETPFIAPLVGRDAIARYWREGAGEAQRNIRFRSRLWMLDGGVAVAHWRAAFTRVPSAAEALLDGVLRVELELGDPLPQCAEFREWWHAAEAPGTAAEPIVRGG